MHSWTSSAALHSWVPTLLCTSSPRCRPQESPVSWPPLDLIPLGLPEAVLHASWGQPALKGGGSCPAKSHLSHCAPGTPGGILCQGLQNSHLSPLPNPEPSRGQGPPRGPAQRVGPWLWTPGPRSARLGASHCPGGPSSLTWGRAWASLGWGTGSTCRGPHGADTGPSPARLGVAGLEGQPHRTWPNCLSDKIGRAHV